MAPPPPLLFAAVRRLFHIAPLAVALALAAGCGEEEGSGAETGTAAETPAPPAETQAPPESQTGCEPVDAPAAKEDGSERRPKTGLDSKKSYSLVVTTNCGNFTIELDPDMAPEATSSLVALAKKGFYAGTIFHRIVPGFVIQGGDPTGTGQGGAGYSTKDKPPDDAKYGKGVVAMAKAGDEPAGTGGSQFFVVTGDEVGLPPEYALVGNVTEGLKVVERIGMLGDPSTEMPTQPVVIESVDVKTAGAS